MIYQCSDPRKKDILLKLKGLNTLALTFMTQGGSQYDARYTALQRTDYWKQAKPLFRAYRELEGNFACDICHKPIVDSWTLHHDPYNIDNLFTPVFLKCVHHQCHPKTVKKRGNKKRTKTVKKRSKTGIKK